MRAALIVVLAALLPAGCAALEPASAEGDPVPAAESEPTAEKPKKEKAKAKKARWKGAKANHYRNAYRICSVFTPEEIARDYGVKAKPRRAARAHARRLYPPQHFRPALQGCLDGFAGRAPRV